MLAFVSDAKSESDYDHSASAPDETQGASSANFTAVHPRYGKKSQTEEESFAGRESRTVRGIGGTSHSQGIRGHEFVQA